jgi:hypothetical protein
VITIVHADGTDCRHLGQPAMDAGQASCPAGLPVTHVRTPSGLVPVGQATEAAARFLAAMAAALRPVLDGYGRVFARLGAVIAADPQLRAMARAASAWDRADDPDIPDPAPAGLLPGQLELGPPPGGWTP